MIEHGMDYLAEKGKTNGKLHIRFVLFILTIGLFISCSTEVEYTTYENEDYSIKHPIDWTVDEDTEYGAHFMIKCPADEQLDGFAENLNLVTEEVPEGTTFEDYMKQAEFVITTFIPDCEVESNEKSEGEVDMGDIIYTATMQDMELKIRQNYRVIGTTAYIITFTSTPDKIADYEAITSHMINSFEVK